MVQQKQSTRTTETAPIKWSEALKLLAVMRGTNQDNTRLMLAAGFYFGLRISDILQLRWQDITSTRFEIREGKTKKIRTVIVHPDFQKIAREILSDLLVYPDPQALVFTHQRSDGRQDKPISVWAANKRIKAVFSKYDVEVQNASSHTLRKTFGRRLWEAHGKTEAALTTLSKVFNHSSMAITRRYIGITQQVIENAYLKL
jgi:integrase